ncbi:AMP-binding protein, partial [Streptomyces sp. NPDC001793]|uniref:AMP-binding protein n=1 Tax=Streptomyces sp. NPDC001793 TaxID=3154657 RepID=UPI0033278847
MTDATGAAGARNNTVDGVLRRSARRVPERTAVRYADRSWSYRALDDAVTAAARVLLAEGLRPGDRVASYGHNSDAYLIGFLACARAGLVHVPVNHGLAGEELAYLLGQSGSALVLTDTALAARLPDGTRTVPLHGAPDGLLERLAEQPAGAPPRGRRPPPPAPPPPPPPPPPVAQT